MQTRKTWGRAMMAPPARENADARPRFGPPSPPLRPGDRVRRAGLDDIYYVASDPFDFEGRLHVYLKTSPGGRRKAHYAGCARVDSLTRLED